MTSPEELLIRYARDLPRFDDGRIDYSDAKDRVVLNSLIEHDGQMLLLQRSERLTMYPLLWSGVSGYVDTNESVEEHMYQELSEELSIARDQVRSVSVYSPLIQEDTQRGIVWHVYPVHVVLTDKPTLKLDWETKDVVWVQPKEIASRELVPGYVEVVSAIL